MTEQPLGLYRRRGEDGRWVAGSRLLGVEVTGPTWVDALDALTRQCEDKTRRRVLAWGVTRGRLGSVSEEEDE